MTNLGTRVEAFIELGAFLRDYCEFDNERTNRSSSAWFEKMDKAIRLSGHHNGWFTKENILFALRNWGKVLTKKHIASWIADYDLDKNQGKSVAIIMAGNIPLVGFHDFLCVLICGNKALVKLSDNDKILLPLLSDYLKEVQPLFEDDIEFIDGQLQEFDAVIATGSNNTGRYFEYYFKEKPNIIRKNRSSVAILDGGESHVQLEALGEDIFRYYGLGCRSVSKIFVTEGYDFDALFKGLFSFKSIIDQRKYANNYDYNKAVYLMSDFKILDNGFLILKEDSAYHSPIASLNYEYYESTQELQSRLLKDTHQLQCIVAANFTENTIEFGQTQRPSLTDYADGIDTVDFLLKT